MNLLSKKKVFDKFICCKEMGLFLENIGEPVCYNSLFREYYFDCKGPTVITLSYCPWCGHKLPNSLRDEFFDTLEDIGVEVSIGDYKTNQNIPAEFRTDEWWKKRGL